MVSMEEPEKNLLQLGKGGMDDPSGGAPPHLDPPASFFKAKLNEICSFSKPSPEALDATI